MLRFLYPDRCVFCGAELPRGQYACERCAPLPRPVPADVCPLCGKDPCACRDTYFDGFAAVWYYESAVASALRLCKFRRREQCLRWFGGLLGAAVRSRFPGVLFDAVVPVPMTFASLERRGFNQAAELARYAAKVLGAPLDEHILRKMAEGERQSSLPPERRRANVLGLFQTPAPKRVTGKTILIVDDIRTTGATLEECAKTLHFCEPAALYGASLTVSTDAPTYTADHRAPAGGSAGR